MVENGLKHHTINQSCFVFAGDECVEIEECPCIIDGVERPPGWYRRDGCQLWYVQLVSCTLVDFQFLTLTLPDDKILDWSKLKQIADDISKCIKNGK